MQHLDEGTIHAWLDGALDAADSSRVERHVAECQTCSEAVAEARGLIAGASRIVSSLDVVPGNVIPPSSAKAPSRGWLWRSLRLTPGRAAIAATLLLAVGTMLTVQHSPVNNAPPPASVATTVAADAPPSAALPKPSAPGAAIAVQAAPAAPTPAIASRQEKTAIAANAAPSVTPPVALADSAASRGVVASAPAADAKKTQPTTALSNVVVASGGVARGTDSATGDALARRRAILDSIRSGTAGAARMRQLSAAQELASAKAFAGAPVRANDASECFRVSSDSAIVWQTGVSFPRQFSLQQNAGPPPQNVVRAVLPDGRIDSAITGARWQRITPTTTRLYLTRTTGELTPTLTLHFADGRVAGELSTATGLHNIDLVRAICRP